MLDLYYPKTLHAAPAGPGDWSTVRLFGHAFRNDDYRKRAPAPAFYQWRQKLNDDPVATTCDPQTAAEENQAAQFVPLQAGTFEQFRAAGDEPALQIDATQLAMILGGVSLQSVQRRKRFQQVT